jgi:hypothetical protein
MRAEFLLVILTTMSVASDPAHAASPLTGAYSVIDSDACANIFNLFSSQQVTVSTTAAGITVDRGGDNGAFGYKVGHDANVLCAHADGFCFSDEQFSFDGFYSSDGRRFKAVQTLVEVLTGANTPTYTGEVDFTVKGKTLEIDTTAGYQPLPVPMSICLMNKRT